MSSDAFILAKRPLPPREDGWEWNPDDVPPLWFAAVHVNVSDAANHRSLAPFLEQQGGAAQIISLSFRYPAAEFAEHYWFALRRWTGGAVVVNGALFSESKDPDPASSLEAIEMELLRGDINELRFEPELFGGWRQPYEEGSGQRPYAAVLCGTDPGKPELPACEWTSAKVEPFFPWAKRDILRAAAVLPKANAGQLRTDYVAVVEASAHLGEIDGGDEKALREALEALAERTNGVLVELAYG